jgi:type II secretory pathway pseudopilin PulG
MNFKTNNLKRIKKRGISLLETMLALAIGSLVIVSSIQGMNRYTEDVQTQAAANQLDRLISAAETWADDNYDALTTGGNKSYNAAQTITQLGPYLGNTFPTDPFRNQFRMATRKYQYSVPDPANPGSFINRDAMQLLLVGYNTDPGELASKSDIRINIANTAGAKAGFISTSTATCSNGTGGKLAAGNICGAFGSYALNATQFAANTLNNAIVVGLITKGDSSFYGDQLYRYNYGDPELNTMRTTLTMDSPTDPNDIRSPRSPLALRASNAAGTNVSSINIGNNNGGGLGDITLSPGNTNRTTLIGRNGDDPILRSNTATTQIGLSNGRLRLGDVVTRTFKDVGGGSSTIYMGDGELRTDRIFSELVKASTVNSLFPRRTTPLRLQDFRRGEVIVGERGRYRPNANGIASGTVYELSDGVVTAGLVKAQDIVCADCGGNLSEILPRWRHMGTYFVAYTSGQGTRVPKPACTDNRRGTENRVATSDEQGYLESIRDNRYDPRILLISRQIQSKNIEDSSVYSPDVSDIPFNSHMTAVNDSASPNSFWRVSLDKTRDNVYTTAFALTYCVFTGGSAAQQDPTNTSVAGLGRSTPTSVGTWTELAN